MNLGIDVAPDGFYIARKVMDLETKAVAIHTGYHSLFNAIRFCADATAICIERPGRATKPEARLQVYHTAMSVLDLVDALANTGPRLYLATREDIRSVVAGIKPRSSNQDRQVKDWLEHVHIRCELKAVAKDLLGPGKPLGKVDNRDAYMALLRCATFERQFVHSD